MSSSQTSQTPLPQYPLRLPSYRFLHQTRYHPYAGGRNAASGIFDPMQTIDYTYHTGQTDQPARPSFVLSIIHEEDAADAMNLDVVVSELEGVPMKKDCRRAFIYIVIDFALAMRHKLRQVKYAVKKP
ncbi:hypothetical protein DENSPDRAFT_833194 [Dentipellis sp. KUC8613]|nr:hypothetical protein DENSPDRAFT_833194 [Dentipellis sp. KUC8613]